MLQVYDDAYSLHLLQEAVEQLKAKGLIGRRRKASDLLYCTVLYYIPLYAVVCPVVTHSLRLQVNTDSGDISLAAADSQPPSNTSVGVSGELSTASLLGSITHFLLDLLRDVELLRSYTEQVRDIKHQQRRDARELSFLIAQLCTATRKVTTGLGSRPPSCA